MNTIKIWKVCCTCGREKITNNTDRDESRRIAEEDGWVVEPFNPDTCPGCVCKKRMAECRRKLNASYRRRHGQEHITCKLCGDDCDPDTAHLHEGRWIGDDCCWDERLKSTE